MAGKLPILIAFGRRLREKRLAAGLSQAALAEMMGFHRVSIAKLEAGRTNITLATLQQLADLLGCEPADLLAPDPPLPPRGKRQ